MRQIKKHAKGCYRISGSKVFGQIRKVGREWHAEMRRREDGQLLGYAGIWTRLEDARSEIEYNLDHEPI